MIDLLFAEPGTIFKCRNDLRLRFTNRLLGSAPESRCYRFEICGVNQHNGTPLEVFRFRNGSVSESGEMTGNDIVSVEEIPQGFVDLSKCSLGQTLLLRNGSTQKLCVINPNPGTNGGRPYKVGLFFYSKEGRVAVGTADSPLDIVRVLSYAETQALSNTNNPPVSGALDMEQFPMGTKFRRRDGKITTLVERVANNPTYPFKCATGKDTDTYTPRGSYMNGNHRNEKDLVKVFKVERDKPLGKEEVLHALNKLVKKLSRADADKAATLLSALS